MAILFDHTPQPGNVLVQTYSAWAGCRLTRRCTSGGTLTWGKRLIPSRSKTPSLIALSLAEAELYSTAEGSAEGVGLQLVMKDFGVHAGVVLVGDASVALGIVQLHGLGKFRSIDTPSLWTLQKMADKTFPTEHVACADIPAYGQTTFVGSELIRKCALMLNCKSKEGHAYHVYSIYTLSSKGFVNMPPMTSRGCEAFAEFVVKDWQSTFGGLV